MDVKASSNRVAGNPFAYLMAHRLGLVDMGNEVPN